jgi:glycosyltransferase involved in cell wall biosynthesis
MCLTEPLWAAYPYGGGIGDAEPGPVVEIVIVNDSSMDDFFAIARKHLQSNHSIPLIDNHINTGLVDTRYIRWQHCTRDKVFIPDADHLIDDVCLSA